MIKPTIGSQVRWKAGKDRQECAATIALVQDDRLVNLCVISPTGQTNGATNVVLRQPEDNAPAGSYCEWPEHIVRIENGAEAPPRSENERPKRKK